MENNITVLEIKNVFYVNFRSGFIEEKPFGRSCCVLAYLIEGAVDYEFDGYTLKITPQTLFYLSEGSRYAIRIHKASKLICVDIKTASPITSRVFGRSASTKADFERLFYTYNEKSVLQHPQMFSTLYTILTRANMLENKLQDRADKKFTEIITYISKNYENPFFNVGDIADFAGISETHLRRIFAAKMQISPVKYINSLRIKKAKVMLKNSNFSVEEIAYCVGINDRFYFSRIFKKELGMSPTEYRKTDL